MRVVIECFTIRYQYGFYLPGFPYGRLLDHESGQRELRSRQELVSSWDHPEDEFLDVIGTEFLRVFLLCYSQSHLLTDFNPLPPIAKVV
jgi:hypothetical protein